MTPCLATLAELPPYDSPAAIGWLFLAVAAAFAAINQILKLVDRMKEKPVPADTYATKLDQVEVKARLDRAEQKIDENYKQLDGKRSISVANLHEALKAQTDSLNKRIDEVPGRVIALLNDTKSLHRQ